MLNKINLPAVCRWFILGTVVGIVAGIGAILFLPFCKGALLLSWILL